LVRVNKILYNGLFLLFSLNQFLAREGALKGLIRVEMAEAVEENRYYLNSKSEINVQ